MTNLKKAKSNAMLILTAFIWGAAFVAQSIGMDYIGPFTFNTARFFIGGLVLIPCIFLLRKVAPSPINLTKTAAKNQLQKTGIKGGICCGTVLCLASTLQQIGISYTTVGKAGFITALYIIIVPLLGLFFKKKVPSIVWCSVLIASIGMYLLCITEGVSIHLGDFLVFLGAFAFSGHILIIDYFSPKADGVFMSCIQFFTAAIISCFFTFLLEKPAISSILSAWAPILYAGILSCGVAYTLQVIAQKNTDPVIASLLMSLESVFSLLAGWIILRQKLSCKELFGCLLVFTAIILAQSPDIIKIKRKNKPPE